MKVQADDLLDRHFAALEQSNEAQAQAIESSETLPADTASLFGLVRLLWTLLIPVRPRPEFRVELRDQLHAEMQRRRTQAALGYGQSRGAARSRWVVPVAAIGTASVVGALAYWRFSRHAGTDRDVLAA